ncbi:MAG: hypothetical protein IJB93_07050 [Clostridia bacterium]|nr:hypothetical protein [Clostridia bacterium]
MKHKHTTRSALFTSIISMLLCVSMLVGATFAWFTDEVKSGVNMIAAGNLDIEVTNADGLLTDSIRAELLKECGYEVDIIEFVDFAHSPKNLMLRCKLKKKKTPQLQSIKELTEKYGFTQKLFELVEKGE